MPSQFKCPHCEKEIEKLKVTYEYGSWWTRALSWIPLLCFGVYFFFISDMFKSHDISDLEVRLDSVTNVADSPYQRITATVTNSGKERWSRICIDAEVYNSENLFVKEYVYHLAADVYPNSGEKVMIEPNFTLSEGQHFKLKISDGSVDRF